MKTVKLISQSADGRRAQIVVHERGHDGKMTSHTRHVVVRSGQYEYSKPNAKGEETVVESYEVGGGS